MGTAFQCDRCGALYAPKIKVNKYYVGSMDSLKTLDLCPVCADILDGWMDKYKNKEDDNEGRKETGND